MSPFKYGCTVSDEFFCPRPDLEKRLADASRLGFSACVLPGASKSAAERLPVKMEFIYVDKLSEAIDVLFS